ncbi:hypothetical protein ISCGN_000613 [Ixodes scapularis]
MADLSLDDVPVRRGPDSEPPSARPLRERVEPASPLSQRRRLAAALAGPQLQDVSAADRLSDASAPGLGDPSDARLASSLTNVSRKFERRLSTSPRIRRRRRRPLIHGATVVRAAGCAAVAAAAALHAGFAAASCRTAAGST